MKFSIVVYTFRYQFICKFGTIFIHGFSRNVLTSLKPFKFHGANRLRAAKRIVPVRFRRPRNGDTPPCRNRAARTREPCRPRKTNCPGGRTGRIARERTATAASQFRSAIRSRIGYRRPVIANSYEYNKNDGRLNRSRPWISALLPSSRNVRI